jgi:predicted MFS family arabinose efflux permease
MASEPSTNKRQGWDVDALFGASSFVLLLLSAGLARQPPLAQANQTTKLSHVLRSRPFALLYASWVLATTGLIVAMVFLTPFAHTIGASPVAAAALISVIGGMSILGRGGIGFITRKADSMQLYKLSVLVMAASYLLWILFPATGGWWLSPRRSDLATVCGLH